MPKRPKPLHLMAPYHARRVCQVRGFFGVPSRKRGIIVSSSFSSLVVSILFSPGCSPLIRRTQADINIHRLV